MLSSVDLPEPDGPTMATHSPGQIERSTSRSACTGGSTPKTRDTPASSTTGRDTPVPAGAGCSTGASITEAGPG